MEEIWKPILDEDIQVRYAVSNLGRVLDLKNKKYMNHNDNGAGYKTVGLQKPGSIVKVFYIHRLVAMHFLDNPYNKPQVGHKDHNRENNVLDNLEWVTQRENTRYGIEEGRINVNRPKTNRKVTPELICEIAKLEYMGYGVNEIAVKIGFPRTTVSSVFNGRSNWELFEFAREEIKSFCASSLDTTQPIP